jgi:hypothetical protein
MFDFMWGGGGGGGGGENMKLKKCEEMERNNECIY